MIPESLYFVFGVALVPLGLAIPSRITVESEMAHRALRFLVWCHLLRVDHCGQCYVLNVRRRE